MSVSIRLACVLVVAFFGCSSDQRGFDELVPCVPASGGTAVSGTFTFPGTVPANATGYVRLVFKDCVDCQDEVISCVTIQGPLTSPVAFSLEAGRTIDGAPGTTAYVVADIDVDGDGASRSGDYATFGIAPTITGPTTTATVGLRLTPPVD